MARWFAADGKQGHRTVEQQLQGLERLGFMLNQHRKEHGEGLSVLDVGCAEGAISMACAGAGARKVHGIEVRPEAVMACVRESMDRPPELNGVLLVFETGDANVYEPAERYDVVLMLGVLHKLRDPSAACRRLAACCDGMVVIRLPPAGAPVIVDARSGGKPHHVGQVMSALGFELIAVDDGPACDGNPPEWVGYWVRTEEPAHG